MTTEADLADALLDAAAADAVHALRLPRLPRLRRGDRRRRRPTINRCPPGGAEGIVAAGAHHRPAGRCRSIPSCGAEGPRALARDRRGLVHRLHAVPQGLPGRLHRRRGQAHAHRHRRAVHRLRAVPAGLPGRLHRAGRRRAASAPAGTPGAPAQADAGATPLRAPPAARRRAGRATSADGAEHARRAGSRRVAAALARARDARASRLPERAHAAPDRADEDAPTSSPSSRPCATPIRSRPASSNTPACSSCSPRCCCRRRPPIVGVNKATRRLFAIAPTPQKMLALGLPALEDAIRTIGLFRNKAKNLHRDLPHPGRAARRPGAADARGARGPARRRPQDRQRGAQRRLRRTDDGGRHARLSRRQPHRPGAREARRWRSRPCCSSACPRRSWRMRTTG